MTEQISGGHKNHQRGYGRSMKQALAKATALAAVGLLLYLIYLLRVLVVDVILAITLASAISPLAEKLEAKKIPRGLTVVGTFVLIAVFYVGIGLSIYQPLKEQAKLFVVNWPSITESFVGLYNQVLELAGDKAALITMHVDDFRSPALKLVGQTLDLTAGFMGLLFNSILVIFLSAYFIIEAKLIWDKLLLWVPPSKRKLFASLIVPIGARMGGYVRGQILVSTAVAAFFSTGLTLIGVKYGLVLGLLAGLLNLLPFVGSFIATVLAVFVALNQSPLMAVMTVLLFVVEQGVESNFIVPHLLGKQVGLHPLAVMFAILTGATLAGAVGAIAAIPLVSALVFLGEEFYLKPLNSPMGKGEHSTDDVSSEHDSRKAAQSSKAAQSISYRLEAPESSIDGEADLYKDGETGAQSAEQSGP